LSWDTPFAQVSEAITASEAWRATFASTNQYIRNIIYIQGTGTSYEALTALPYYCDMIGIGADPRGDGFGIVVIKGEDEDAAAGTTHGLYMANIQFAVSGDTGDNAFDVVVLAKSTIENCTFTASTDADTEVCNAALRSSSHFVGSSVRNCVFGTTNGIYAFNIGFDHSDGVGNCNLFENNCFFGNVHGVKVLAGINDHSTVWKGNLMHSYQGNVQPSTAGMQMGLHSMAVGNYICGTDAISEADPSQTIYNMTVATITHAFEDAF